MASLLKGLLKLPVIGQRMIQFTSCTPAPRLLVTGQWGSSRYISSLPCRNQPLLQAASATPISCNSLLLAGLSPMVQPCRTYKVKTALKRRCSACYFVRRHGRLFVECKRKPRHKQMQKLGKHKLWREDYSKGRIEEAMTWGWRKERFYWLGDNKFVKHNWLDGKIGRTV